MVLSAPVNRSLTYNVTLYICLLHRQRLSSLSSSLYDMHNLPFLLPAAISPTHLLTSPPLRPQAPRALWPLKVPTLHFYHIDTVCYAQGEMKDFKSVNAKQVRRHRRH